MQLVEIKAAIPLALVSALDELLLERELTAWNLVEDVIKREAWVIGMFPSELEARESWAALAATLPQEAKTEAVVRVVTEQDWRDSYKVHFKAWQFGRLHWVPVWEREDFSLPAGHEVLWLDPGLAFGTGNHETTRLCVERLVAWADAQGTSARVIDAGCGSGILALSAAKLGFGTVCGFDNDVEAVRVSEENASLNGMAGRVEFYVGDLVTGLAGRQAELVLANILADVLMRFAPQLVAAVAPAGQLVLSGILAAEGGQVREVFAGAAPGWTCDARVLGEWTDLVLSRPA